MNFRYLQLFTCCIAFFLFACGDDDDASAPENNNPGSFTVSVSDITSNTATISWTASVDPDGDDVNYSVTIENQLLVSDIMVTSVDVTGLEEGITYNGVVTASDGNNGEATASFSFTTTESVNQNPGSFTVAVSNITATGAELTWDAAVDPDGDDVTYKVMLAGSEITSGETGLTFNLTSLTADTEYQGRVIAEDGNGGSSEATFAFKTEAGDAATCTNDNSTDQNNRNCDMGPDANTYDDATVNGAGDREVVTNGIPTHE
ncbi:MAG: fibronectin type III domain-containing protein, partial [Bacteroidota bacterium]